MKRILPLIVWCLALGAAGSPAAQVCAPAPPARARGGAVPLPGPVPAPTSAARGDLHASMFRHAWIGRAERAREARARLLSARGFFQPGLLATAAAASASVDGTLRVPVFCVKYANTPADPYPVSVLQARLFDGPHDPMTAAGYFDEVSYGNLDVTGTVYGWTQLSGTDTYYEGGPGCGGVCDNARVAQLITAALVQSDATVDFGQYDNDGPDGIPNSADDDGFVDVAVFIHPESGGECGGNDNLRAQRFSLSALTGTSWTSRDFGTTRGAVRVDDYIILPARACDGVSVADIGMFCHQLGHVFGLPDLVDAGGGSSGAGDWCLMGTGAWNTPDSPARPCAWVRDYLGWSTVVRVGSRDEAYAIPAADLEDTIFRLDVMEPRWRRDAPCAISGAFSMRCGLSAEDAAARHWLAGDGYGNGWRERVSRSFRRSGPGPVTLAYRFAHDLENGYDVVNVRVRAGNSTVTVATHTGTDAGEAVIDITGAVPMSAAYEISFEMASDLSFADDDGEYPSTCGAFVFDDVAVTGGGEDHHADFEVREDGWACAMDDPAEYFLAEHRRNAGTDAHLHGTGLALWHIDRDVASLGGDASTGGASHLMPRGVTLVQADGLDQLGAGTNHGDAGDLFPGTSGNTVFGSATVPASTSHAGHETYVAIALTGTGDPMSAVMRAGWAPPVHASHTPTGSSTGSALEIDVFGAGFVRGASVELVAGETRVSATSVEWVGSDLLRADFGAMVMGPDVYDLRIVNPGGGTAVVPAAIEVTGTTSGAGPARSPRSVALGDAFPNPFAVAARIPFELPARARATIEVFDLRGARVRRLVDRDLPRGAHIAHWDGRDDDGDPLPSGIYFVRLRAGGVADARKLVLAR